MLFRSFDGVPHKSFAAQHQQLTEMVGQLEALDRLGINRYFTMASARDNTVDGLSNLVAEIMTQEVVDSRGFNVKMSEDSEEINALLTKMVETVKSWNLRKLLERNMKGKVVFAHVYNIIS